MNDTKDNERIAALAALKAGDWICEEDSGRCHQLIAPGKIGKYLGIQAGGTLLFGRKGEPRKVRAATATDMQAHEARVKAEREEADKRAAEWYADEKRRDNSAALFAACVRAAEWFRTNFPAAAEELAALEDAIAKAS